MKTKKQTCVCSFSKNNTTFIVWLFFFCFLTVKFQNCITLLIFVRLLKMIFSKIFGIYSIGNQLVICKFCIACKDNYSNSIYSLLFKSREKFYLPEGGWNNFSYFTSYASNRFSTVGRKSWDCKVRLIT